MGIAPGTRVGPYEITAKLGEGGMGEVYRATDTKLKREVAIKVLPAALAGDSERLARFQREAEVLAQLNHPHIAQIHGLEESDGLKALVMELVEGPTLADRIGEGPLPVEEALPIARQIAEALEAAHAQGIIHRDLKPANVKVRDDGTVKVLDFGLAKAMETGAGSRESGAGHALANSPTITSPAMTEAGMILGTAAYMAPEQARGKPVDERADIWAFGCVLYEMLTGTRVFEAEDVSLTLAAVLRSEPDWSRLPRPLHPRLGLLLERCLRKEPRHRLHAIADARIEIDGVLDDPQGIAAGRAAASAGVAADIRPWKRLAIGLAALAAMSGVVAAWALLRPAPTAPALAQRVSLVLPAERPMVFGRIPNSSIAVSPDGRDVVYVSENPDGSGPPRLVARSLSTRTVRDLTDTEGFQPFFSPDGRWVGFFAGDALRKVPLEGGNALTLASRIDGAGAGFGAWTDDDEVVFAAGGGYPQALLRVSADGGAVEPLTAVDAAAGERGHLWPEFLPGTRTVLFTVRTEGFHIEALDLDTRQRRVVVENASQPRYLAGGYLLYQRDRDLVAVPFDRERLVPTGPAVPILDEIRTDGPGQGRDGLVLQFGVSRTGTLVYAPPPTEAEARLGIVGRNGSFEPFGPPLRNSIFWSPHLSPDGQMLAFGDGVANAPAVYFHDLGRGSTDRLALAYVFGPAWHPIDRTVAVASRRGAEIGVYLWDPSGAERLLTPTQSEGVILRNMSWSPDGGVLAFTRQLGGDPDIWIVSADDPSSARPLIAGPALEFSPRFSPDGRWLTYVSDESGRREVYVRRYPEGERLRVSADGASGAVWSRDGTELFLQGVHDGTPTLLSVPVARDGETLRLGTPTPLFDLRMREDGVDYAYAFGNNIHPNFDVFPDGRRFVMIRTREVAALEIVLVQHLQEELRRLAPSN